VLSDNGSGSDEYAGFGVIVPDRRLKGVDVPVRLETDVVENSERRLCFTAYNIAIKTRTIASVSLSSASLLLSSLSLPETRKYLVKFRTLVITVVN
jgi:hypothetical protein